MPGMVQIVHGFQTKFKPLARNVGPFLNEVQFGSWSWVRVYEMNLLVFSTVLVIRQGQLANTTSIKTVTINQDKYF